MYHIKLLLYTYYIARIIANTPLTILKLELSANEKKLVTESTSI